MSDTTLFWTALASAGVYRMTARDDEGRWCELFLDGLDKRRLVRAATLPDCTVALVPRISRLDHTELPGHLLWARLENGGHEVKLKAFRPGPSLVVREGPSKRRVAIWILSREMDAARIERGCKRIAYRLDTPRKYASADFQCPVPGTELKWDYARKVERARAVPVTVEHFDPVIHKPSAVMGHLKDAPAPRDWRTREAA